LSGKCGETLCSGDNIELDGGDVLILGCCGDLIGSSVLLGCGNDSILVGGGDALLLGRDGDSI